MCVFFCLFFFFKQKTAYEMRISDWSSDVCSSDLKSAAVRLRADGHNVIETREPGGTPLAENLRAMILNADNDMDTTTQLLLLNAARRSHIQQVILPNIAQGAIVLCDRFLASSLVFQSLNSDGTRNLDETGNASVG